MLAEFFGTMFDFTNPEIVNVLGSISAIFTILTTMVALHSKFDSSILNCSVRLKRQKISPTKFMIGKNADSNAIIFSSFIQSSLFYFVSILLNSFVGFVTDNKAVFFGTTIVEFIILLVQDIVTLLSVKHYNVAFTGYSITCRAARILCWILFGVGVFVGEFNTACFFVMVVLGMFIYVSTLLNCAATCKAGSVQISCGSIFDENVITVGLTTGEVIDSRNHLLYFVITEDSSFTILCYTSLTGAVEEISKDKVKWIHGDCIKAVPELEVQDREG